MAWQKAGANSAVTWSDRVASPLRWQPQKELPGNVPSVASLFMAVKPQAFEPNIQPQNTFTHRIRSEFPAFYVASGTLAVITSGFTQGGL